MIACKDHAKNPIKGYFACPGCEVQMLRDEVERIKSENEELRKDADRYRWLKRQRSKAWKDAAEIPMNHTDAYIDAAMAKEAK